MDEGARGTRQRSTALALAFLFLVGTFTSAAGVHGCPNHHHHAPSPASLAAGPESGAATNPENPADEPAGSACTCLGDCQAGAPSALHRPPVRDVLQPEAVARLRPAPSPELRPAPKSEYFLPYPLGPPAA